MFTDLCGTESQVLTTSKSSFHMRLSNKIKQLSKGSLFKEEYVQFTIENCQSKCLKSINPV